MSQRRADSMPRTSHRSDSDALPRVLVLHPSDELYGADRVLLEVLDAVEDMIDPIVVLPSDSPPGPLSVELERRGITVERLRFPVLRRRYGSPIGLVRLGIAVCVGVVSLLRLARRYRVRVIHANTSVILVAPLLAALARVPWVWHVHEIVERPWWLSRTIGWISILGHGHVVGVSHAVARHLARHGGRAAVILNAAPPLEPARTSARKKRAVLMVGRVNGWKGHPEFVKAARLLHEAGLRAPFRIVGGPVPGRPDLYEALEREVSALDPNGTWLVFVGHSADVTAEMERALVVVVPSTSATGITEAFNLTALEAMALGLPVIASDVGGLPEVVVDGETGILVPPGDVDALARAVRRIVEDQALSRRFGEAGRQRAVNVFGRDVFKASWRQVYRRVLGEDITS